MYWLTQARRTGRGVFRSIDGAVVKNSGFIGFWSGFCWLMLGVGLLQAMDTFTAGAWMVGIGAVMMMISLRAFCRWIDSAINAV